MNELMEFLSDEDTKKEIEEAMKEGKIKFIEKDKETIGFLTWCEFVRNGKLYIYIGNIFILPEHRNASNFFKLRDFFRSKYPDATLYGVRDKQSQEVYYYRR